VLVVLALPARKAIDDEDDNGRAQEFLIVLVLVVVLALSVRLGEGATRNADRWKRV
jgi:hypothetical protein